MIVFTNTNPFFLDWMSFFSDFSCKLHVFCMMSSNKMYKLQKMTKKSSKWVWSAHLEKTTGFQHFFFQYFSKFFFLQNTDFYRFQKKKIIIIIIMNNVKKVLKLIPKQETCSATELIRVYSP